MIFSSMETWGVLALFESREGAEASLKTLGVLG